MMSISWKAKAIKNYNGNIQQQIAVICHISFSFSFIFIPRCILLEKSKLYESTLIFLFTSLSSNFLVFCSLSLLNEKPFVKPINTIVMHISSNGCYFPNRYSIVTLFNCDALFNYVWRIDQWSSVDQCKIDLVSQCILKQITNKML